MLISACTFQLFIHPLLPSVASNLADFYLSDQCNTFLGHNKVQMGLKQQKVIKMWANYNCIQFLQKHKSRFKKAGYNNFSITTTVSKGITL